MKKIGLIDNLQDLQAFVGNKYDTASAAEIMAATGGNTGNVAFVHAARKIIGNPIVRVGWGWTPGVVKERVDHLVICCANQLGAHADLGDWADRLEQFGLPVTLVGLGAQADNFDKFPTLPEGTKKFLEVVKGLNSAECPNIAVRGEFTRDVLQESGVTALPIGCPSLHISSEKNLGKKIANSFKGMPTQRVAVAAGNPWHGVSAPLERKLVELLESYAGEYIVQHPLAMVQYSLGEVGSIDEKTRNRFSDVYGSDWSFDVLIDWFRRRSAIYVDPANWLHAIRRYDIAIGPRYHGIALAVQAGVGGAVITIDSRTEELCLGTAIKHISLEQALASSVEQLIEASMWNDADADAFDVARVLKARQYVEFLQGNGIEPSQHLISCAE
jgi:hypothetical protein